MPCAEIVNAIAWNKQSTGGSAGKEHPVKAYFTKHFGTGGAAPTSGFRDAVHYASGDVIATDTPAPHLKGTLKAAKNTEKNGEMIADPRLTYDVEIFPDGTLTYLMKIDGKTVGGVLQPTKVQAACVNNVLLTATSGSEVVAVGVALEPPF